MIFNYFNKHFLISDCKSQHKIEKEAQKIIKLIPRVNLKLGQRLPIHSKVNQGKWFIYKNEKNIYSMLLSFPQSDENLIERFLSKMRNTLKEVGNVKDSGLDLQSYLTNKIIKYGIHHLKDMSTLNQIGKLSFNENLFDSNLMEKKMELEDESTGSFSNELGRNETQTFSELEYKYVKSPKNIKNEIIFEDNEEEEKIDENNDFFNFKMEKSDSPFITSNKIKSADICIKLENRFQDESYTDNKKTNNKVKSINIARYTLLLFFVLMFMVTGKMFIGLNNSSMIVINNSVKHSSNKRSHSKHLL